MFKKFFMMMVMVTMVSGMALAGGYSIKNMTAEVKEALDGRKERFGELRALKLTGAVGENNRGYVEALTSSSSAKSIVSSENRDRKVIYRTIAEQNDLEGALSTIESAFAQVIRFKMLMVIGRLNN
jgi:uncharacterized protein YdbL (DUF1318 family)